MGKLDDLITTGQISEAIAMLESVTKNAPKDWELYYKLAFCYRSINNFDKAVENYEKSIVLNPEEYSTYLNLGVVYQLKEDFNKAIQTLKKAIEIKDDYVLAYNSIALTYKKMADYSTALKWYDLGIKKLFGQVYRRIISAEKVGFEEFIEGNWNEEATNVFIYYAVRDGCDGVLFPTEEDVIQHYNSNNGGQYFVDKKTEKGKMRMMLPNYWGAFHKILKSDNTYSVLLNNKGAVLVEEYNYDEAEACYKESIHFIPEGLDYQPPYVGLEKLRKIIGRTPKKNNKAVSPVPDDANQLAMRSAWLAFQCFIKCKKTLDEMTGHYLIKSWLDEDKERKVHYEAVILALSYAYQELRVRLGYAFRTTKTHEEIETIWTNCLISTLHAVEKCFPEKEYEKIINVFVSYTWYEQVTDKETKEDHYARRIGKIYNVIDAQKVVSNAKQFISKIGVDLLDDAFINIRQEEINHDVTVVFNYSN
ncbi:MAG: tetratricopeptide repeat protein [Clostridiales bacterium]|jgi:tetratricopeptide (TPR) repeat protein|nr:tetratricopeptide repeat protein [Clostridiales bacterium]